MNLMREFLLALVWSRSCCGFQPFGGRFIHVKDLREGKDGVMADTDRHQGCQSVKNLVE